MTPQGWLEIVACVALMFVVGVPLGDFMARVYRDERHPLSFLRPVEAAVLRLCGVDPKQEQTWQEYTVAALLFNGLGIVVVFALQMLQGSLPLNPQGFAAPSWHSSLNTAISFATNTNWQGYGGESTMSYLTQMLALAVQNFLSAATGLAVLVALARGFSRRTTTQLGSFWVDLVRAHLYVLLPLSFLFAIFLVSQGVVQTFDAYVTTASGQTIALGPAASQIAIKQLGTNGGGFFNANSAHPFENPTPLSNFVECWALDLFGVAQCFTFGRLVMDRRQGMALVAAMTAIFVPLLVAVPLLEAHGTPILHGLGLAGGNMEGKEARFGVAASSLWAVATTAASNGSVNAMHDSFTPLGGLVPMWLIQLGEVVYGGVGSGLYGMLMFAVVAVFVAGLMVGRTPEYLGKKIEAWEMKMASIAILLPCAAVLLGTALGVGTEAGLATIYNTASPHGFSEVLYAFSSAANNNGSAFAGLGAATPFYDLLLGLAMLIGRFGVLLPVLAVAGSLAAKKTVAAGPGTLPTHGPLFVVLLVGVVILVGALTFLPALALGPIVEHLRMWS